jgi:hypothetical protein
MVKTTYNISSVELLTDINYLFICNNTEIQRLRSKYIPKYYVQISSVAKIAGIFSLYNAQFWKTSIIFERNQ